MPRAAVPLSLASRLALWMAVCALLLKAAVPWLASVSAQVQGKALVEICTVHGVQTVALDTGEPAAPEPGVAKAGEPCALAAVLAFGAAPPAPVALAPIPWRDAALTRAADAAAPHDASARWHARLRHGPPANA